MIMRRTNPPARVVIPDHDAVKPGTLHQILNEAGISAEELIGLL